MVKIYNSRNKVSDIILHNYINSTIKLSEKELLHAKFVNRIGLLYERMSDDYIINPIINDIGILISFMYLRDDMKYFNIIALEDTDHWIWSICNDNNECNIAKQLNNILIGMKYTNDDDILAIFAKYNIPVSEIHFIYVNDRYCMTRSISTGRFSIYLNDNNYIYQIKNG